MLEKSIIQPAFLPKYRSPLLVNEIRKDPLGYFLNIGVKNGAYTWFSLMGSPVLFLNDATAIEYIFSRNDKNYHKGKYNEGLRPLLGYGVFLSEDNLWKKQRRDTAPIFSGKNFPEFTLRINEAVDAMLKRWEPHIDAGNPIDMNAETMRLTLDVVLRALFHENSETALIHMKDALGTMLNMAEKRIWSLLNAPLSWTLKRPKYKKTLNFLDELTSELINRRRSNKAYPEDLLSRLIECHPQTPEDQKLLRDNVLSFLLAGHETTANGLSWTFFELGRHTEIRQRVINEIDRITDGHNPDNTMVKSLIFTKQAFDEALRLYPPVWTMSRKTLCDDVLPLDDGSRIFVPKDTTVMLCTYAVHRKEQYWDDPESFHPERFSNEKSACRPKFSWFPFGGGPRLCLGFKFAEVESMIVLARVYQKYDLSLIPGQQVEPEPIITLRPDRPVLFRVTHRRNKTGGAQAGFQKAQTMPEEPTTSAKCPFMH